jgi:hypothetical protein
MNFAIFPYGPSNALLLLLMIKLTIIICSFICGLLVLIKFDCESQIIINVEVFLKVKNPMFFPFFNCFFLTILGNCFHKIFKLFFHCKNVELNPPVF